MRTRAWLGGILLGAVSSLLAQPSAPPPARGRGTAEAALNPALPTLFVAGDSTAARAGATAPNQGWGVPFADYFDATKINIANRARGGRSSRTFITEGWWDRLLAELKPGDFVLIQFGHNDHSGINEEPPGSKFPLRARGTIPGLGEESAEIDNVVTKKHEIVHTFGWYMRRMIADVKAKHANPIVVTLTVRDEWTDGKIERGPGPYSQWSAEIAKATGVPLVDLTKLAADYYEKLGRAKVDEFFPNRLKADTTHFTAAAADLNAAFVVAGLRGLPGHPVDAWLSDKGRAITPAE